LFSSRLGDYQLTCAETDMRYHPQNDPLDGSIHSRVHSTCLPLGVDTKKRENTLDLVHYYKK